MDRKTYLPPLDANLAFQVDGLNDDQRAFWTERAAIREFCGAQTRGDAEQAAWLDTLRHFESA